MSSISNSNKDYDYVEDSPHATGDIGAFILAVRNDAAAVRTNTDGDYSPISTDSAGRVGIADLGGSISVDDNGGSLTVDGTVSGTGTFTTKEIRSATPGQTSVASSLTNVTILASNANRLGATVFNDSVNNLFLKLGATASATSFTVKMAGGSYYEVPFNYTGIIDGLWDVATGSARVTELVV